MRTTERPRATHHRTDLHLAALLGGATAVLDLLLLLVVTEAGHLLLAFHAGGATVAAVRALWYPAPAARQLRRLAGWLLTSQLAVVAALLATLVAVHWAHRGTP
ncbi:hypothetical protein ACIRBX_02070 [Kitasatospora sp. NPDC096147]|uniref:hypothetical protein n=1 Tax=Kitasatospora sp. NPDC096147 TaxID=3364093 RepID=UPI00381EE24D